MDCNCDVKAFERRAYMVKTDTALDLPRFFDAKTPLTVRLEYIHDIIQSTAPDLIRIAFALYDHDTDLLKTFINSTKAGEAIQRYEYKLSDSQSLSSIAKSGEIRVIEGISEHLTPNTQHSRWLIEQGYVSSLTIPVYSSGHFAGFVFFDSLSNRTFTDSVQRHLLLYSNLIVMSITSELAAVKALSAMAKSSRKITQLRDFETGKHLRRMSQYARLIAQHIASKYHLNDEYIELLYLFAPLHDIGKIGIPDEVLLKPGKLTPEERKIMQTHVEKGVEILSVTLDDYELSALPDSQLMLNIVKYHHEHMDGSGYPAGVKGEDIPIEGRIIQVADIFDALTQCRPYKKPWTLDEAMAELNKLSAAGKIDQDCVEALQLHRQQIQEIMDSNIDI